MKKFTVFETSIIGIFVGVVIAAYLTFLSSTGGYIGSLLGWLSWKPLISFFGLPEKQLFIVSFIFFIVVYAVYGAIIGLILKNSKKSGTIVTTLILLIVAVGFQQTIVSWQIPTSPQDVVNQTAAIITSVMKPVSSPQQYFGMEATGDLNSDDTDDIAFILHRDDPSRGVLYYLTTAIATSTGHEGTNLVFLGDKVKPQDISINNEIVDIDYTLGTSTTTRQFYAHIINGNLQQITGTSSASTTTATSSIIK